MPWDIVRFPCGSMSTQRTRWPFSAKAAARFSVVVVLATPPFWLANAITFGLRLMPSVFACLGGFPPSNAAGWDRKPPVPLAEKPHRGRDEDEPDERRVERDRHGEADADLLHRGNGDEGEDEEDGDHDRRGARDRARARAQRVGDGALVVARGQPALAHAG